MTSHRLAPIAAAITLTVLFNTGKAAPASAQVPKPMRDTTHAHPSAKGQMMDMPGMAAMPSGPHHALVMAYRDNLTTFTRALQGNVVRSKAVDLDLARPAVSEMRRSFDQMRTHHKAQMTMMHDQMQPPMMAMMQDMEQHLTAVGTHLTALEADLQVSTPDHAKVSVHTAAILTECDGMMKMPATGMPKK